MIIEGTKALFKPLLEKIEGAYSSFTEQIVFWIDAYFGENSNSKAEEDEAAIFEFLRLMFMSEILLWLVTVFMIIEIVERYLGKAFPAIVYPVVLICIGIVILLVLEMTKAITTDSVTEDPGALV